jgi:hypothetical protein
MMVRLPPEQVSLHWDTIKHVAIEVGLVPPGPQGQMAMNNLLVKLLSDLWQCWLVYTIEPDDTRTLHVVILTCIHEDSIAGEKYLDIQALYAFRPFTRELQDACLHGAQEILRNKGCTGIIATTANPRAEQLLIENGFTLVRKVYALKV